MMEVQGDAVLQYCSFFFFSLMKLLNREKQEG